MRNIIIVQSLPMWVHILKETISHELPEIAPYVSYSNSFDNVLTIIPKEGELLVIASDMFHDNDSEHPHENTQNVPDSEKNGDTLAKLIKKINPKAKVWVYSEFPPKSIVHLDGFIAKDNSDDRNIPKILRLIKKD